MRYDYRAHLMNALSFAFMTVLMSGINELLWKETLAP